MNIVTILIAILVFGTLIFFHELGHFCTAKWAGVRVNEFALGMGPVLFSYTKGETRYALRAFPIGGFVSVDGEDEESDSPRALCNISVWKRILFTMAGSIMNLLLGFILLGILSAGQPLIGTTTVAGFGEGAVSNKSLQISDKILRVNGHKVNSNNDLMYEFMRDQDGIMDMEVLRGEPAEKVLLPAVTFNMTEAEDGIKFITMDFKVMGVEPTPMLVLTNTFNWTKSVVKQVWGALSDLVRGRYSVSQLSGPVGVTTAIGQASSSGIRPLLLLVAFITVNLGVFNLLPLPALDGGRLLFLLIELVRRKPISQKYEGYIHAAGFVLLISLMIFVTFNDVIKLF